MALHIRDFRQSDAAGLSRLSAAARLLGARPVAGSCAHLLAGLRQDRIAGGIWLSLEGDTGIIPAILVAEAAGWQSDVQELIAEASLWLASRGAARIEVRAVPEDTVLLAGLLEMHFKPDACAGTMKRIAPGAKRRLNTVSP